MKNGKFGFGIIGCGVIGPWHARAISAVEKSYTAAVCDIIPERANSLGDEYAKEAKRYENYLDLIKDPAVDIVSICTPSGLHSEMVIAAANAGKHILCEKPIDIQLDKIDRMLEATMKNRVKIAGVFQRRTYQDSQKIKNALDQGLLGKMVLGDAYLKYYRSQAYYQSANWRGTWELDGGGALMNQGIHGIDLLLWFMGDVEMVYAKAGALVRNIAVEDTAIALLQYKNGAYGVIQGATSVNPGEATRLELNGKYGTIIFEESKITRWAVTQEEDGLANDQEIQPEKIDHSAISDPKDIGLFGHIRHIEDLIQAIETDGEPMVTGESARKSVELILAIYESARQGREVYLSR